VANIPALYLGGQDFKNQFGPGDLSWLFCVCVFFN